MEIYERPLTDDIYCFTAKAGNKYHTALLSFLLPMMITNDHALKSELGERVFIGYADVPWYLIPFDSADARRLTTRLEKLSLHSEGKEIPKDAVKEIEVPLEFDTRVEPYFQYKIQDNKLYKRENSKWQQVQV